MGRVKEFFGTDRIHLEDAKDPEKLIEYCKKDGKWEEYGTAPAFGKMKKTTDASRDRREAQTAQFLNAIREGKDDDSLAREFPHLYLQSVNKLPTIRCHLTAPLPEYCEVKGFWLVGRSGIGKSRRARWECAQRGSYYVKLANTKWWGGVKKSDRSVIIEDVMPDHRELAYSLKIWADCYPFVAEYKGGEIRIRPEFVYVTSQYDIDRVFSCDSETCEAMKRRFEVIKIEEPWFPPSVSESSSEPPALSDLYASETLLDTDKEDYPLTQKSVRGTNLEIESDWEGTDMSGLSSEEERQRKKKEKKKKEKKERRREITRNVRD